MDAANLDLLLELDHDGTIGLSYRVIVCTIGDYRYRQLFER